MATQTDNILVLNAPDGTYDGTTRTIGSTDTLVLTNTTNPSLDLSGTNGTFTLGSGYTISGDGALILSSTSGNLTLSTTTSGDVVIDSSGDVVVKLAGTTNTDFLNVQDSAAATVFQIAGDGTASIGKTGSTFTVAGNLAVDGTTTTVDSETVLLADNHLYLNSGYTTVSAQTGGLIVNYLPTNTTTATTTSGAFTAGIDGTSDPTVTTDGDSTFAAADFIQISGSTSNDGLYEVQGYNGTTKTITIRSTANGVTDQVEDFTQGQFVAGNDTGATITKVTVSVLRAGADGVWEVGSGSTTGITFNDLSNTAGSTLQAAYDAGQTIALSGGNDLVITTDATTDFTVAHQTSGNWLATDTANSKLILGGVSAATLDIAAATAFTATGNPTFNFGTSQATFGGNVDATSGLDVSGAALTITNQAITQTTGGQVTFAGNVDANSGLDVSGAALTITNQAITQTTGGQVTFAGNVDAAAGVDINADNQSLTIGAGADLTVAHDGTNTTMTSVTGDLIVDNTNVTGSSIMRLGTDTNATDFQVQNNSAVAQFTVDGSGQATFVGNLDATNGVDVTGAVLTTAVGITNSSGEVLVSGGNLQLNDNITMSWGTNDNWALTYDATTDKDLELVAANVAPVTAPGSGFTIAPAPGGAASGGTGAGVGGDFQVTSGVGGAASTGVGDAAGVGGLIALTGGVGGAGNTNNDGAAGGAITLTSGAGGAGVASQTGGVGGNLVLAAGAGGAAGGGTQGSGGNILINAGAGLSAGTINIGTTNSSAINMGKTTVETTFAGGIKLSFTGGTDAILSLGERTTPATPAVNLGLVYTKDVNTKTELFYLNSSGVEEQLTGAGVTSVTLQEAYDSGQTITLANAKGDMVITLDEATPTDFTVTGTPGNYLTTDATNDQLELGSASVTVGILGEVDTNLIFENTVGTTILGFGTAANDTNGRVLDINGSGGGADVATGAGTGGDITLDGGPGGAAGTNTAGGLGGLVALAGGAGGAGSGTQAGGNGGNLRLNAGAGGSDGGGGAGTDGTLELAQANTTSITLGNVTNNTTITQSGTGQVTFTGNVDANSGLDVSGAALTIANQAITQTTGGQVTFAGNVDATNGLDVTTAALTAAAGLTVTGGAVAIGTSVTTITLDPTDNFTLNMDATKTATITVASGLADAFKVQEGANSYLAVDTTSGSESVDVSKFADLVVGGGVTFACNGAVSAGDVLQIVNVSGVAKVDQAINTSEAAAQVVGVALTGGTDTNIHVLTTLGHEITMTFPSELTSDAVDIGKIVYLDSTAGQATITAPSASGSVVTRLGVITDYISATSAKVWFAPQRIGAIA